jgi:hypothetical protein
MQQNRLHRQPVWHTLTREQKLVRIAELRRRQQAELEAEGRRLQVLLG